MLKLIQIVTIALALSGCGGRDGPPDKTDHRFEDEYMHREFNRMTEWIAKDATLRLRHAHRVQLYYRDMIAYHLGSVMAGIQDTFKHMLSVYRKYSNITHFRQGKYTVEELFNAYEIIKGGLNEIRYEKDLFYQVLADHRKRRERKKNVISDLLKNALDKIKKQREERKAQATNARKSGQALKVWAEGKGAGLSKNLEKTREEVYKRTLRLRAWEKRWKKYVPLVEGVEINIPDIDPESGRLREDAI